MMTLLALESTATIAGVALLQEGTLLGSIRIRHGWNLSGNLLHATEWLLARHRLTLAQVEAVAVDVGPGAFTGLKIGVMLTKTWAHALNCALIGVDAFSACAQEAVAGIPTLVALPARRDALYLRWMMPKHNAPPEPLTEPVMMVQSALADWVARTMSLAELASQPCLQAIGTPRAYEWLAPLLPKVHWRWIEAPSPEGVAQVGWHLWQQGKTVHPFQLVPLYIQPPSITLKR